MLTKSKKYLNIISIIATFFICSCGGATPEGYKQIMDTWVDGKGDDVNTLLSSWGIPSNEYEMPNGNKLLSYLRVGGTTVTVNYNIILDQLQSSRNTWWCNTTFTIDTNGKIIHVSWRGNSCIAEEK